MLKNFDEIADIAPLIPGYPYGSDLTLLNTMYNYPKKNPETGKYDDGSIVIVYIDNVTKKTHHHIIKNPSYYYYMCDDHFKRDYNQLFIEKEKVTRIKAPYKDLEKDIAQRTDNMDFYKGNIMDGNRFANRKLHYLPNVFNSDMSINNHMRMLFDMMYTNSPIEVIKKSYFDIEANTRYMVGDFPELGECPVNAISLINDDDASVHTFLLRENDNPLIEEFEKNLGPAVFQELNQLVIDKVGGIKKAKKFKVDNLKYNMYFFDSEIELLRSFYRMVHKLKPHFMIAWNNAFDTPYIINRIKNLGYDPADILSDSDYSIKFARYKLDTKNESKYEERSESYDIAMDTVVLDQMIQFASRRKSKSKLGSYKLDDIGEGVAKVKKYDYHDITYDIAMLPYLNYKIFVFYNIIDTIVQKCIESKTQDLEYTFAKCLINNTSYDKCHRQTVYLINRFVKEFFNDGYILGNNVNGGNEKDDIRGAMVHNPKHLGDYAKARINGVPINLAYNLVDFDYKSMHPSMTLQNNMAPNTQIGCINIPDMVYKYENRFGGDFVWHRQEDFSEAITTQNIIVLCNRWFGLANYTEMVDDVKEYFSKMYEMSLDWDINKQECWHKIIDKECVTFTFNRRGSMPVVFHNRHNDVSKEISEIRKAEILYAGE